MDLAVRSTNASNTGGTLLTAVGIDIYKSLSSLRGDWGSLVLQGYFTRVGPLDQPADIVWESEEWDFGFRIFEIHFTGRNRRGLNLKAGHIEVAYGIERSVDTNGTVRQFVQGQNLGLKADWGVGIYDEFEDLEYEFSFTRGSGRDWEDDKGTWALSTRLATPRNRRQFIGLSMFAGEVLDPRGYQMSLKRSPESVPANVVEGVVDRRRVGLEGFVGRGRSLWLGEISYGTDFGEPVVNGFVEWDFEFPRSAQLFYAQLRSLNQRFDAGWDNSTAVVAGYRWTARRHWILSLAVTRNLEVWQGTEPQTALTLQARFRS